MAYSLVPEWDEIRAVCRMVQCMTSFWNESASVGGVTFPRELPMMSWLHKDAKKATPTQEPEPKVVNA